MSRWTQFDVIVEASKYLTRSKFRDGNRYAYMLALKWQMMDGLFPDSSQKLVKAINRAKFLGNATLFRKWYPAEARLLHRHGYSNLGNKITP